MTNKDFIELHVDLLILCSCSNNLPFLFDYRKYKQEQHTGVFEQLDELTETVVCNDDGMVFDPNYFKAVKEVRNNNTR